MGIAGMSTDKIFDTREGLAAGCAERVGEVLRQAAGARGEASMALSGGSTPRAVYDILSGMAQVPWEKVRLTLTDERQNAAADGKDNETMVRASLLRGAARFARFSPLDGRGALTGFPLPFDLVLLGMGTDGHIASIFPDGEGMEAARHADAGDVLETTPAPLPPEAPYSRWTLSMRTITAAREIILLISGEEKRAVLEQARTKEGKGLPVRKLLKKDDLPLSVFWAP